MLAGIPRGGIAVAFSAARHLEDAVVLSTAEAVGPRAEVDAPLIVVDDIMVTGNTAKRAYNATGAAMVATLVHKSADPQDHGALSAVRYASAVKVPLSEWVQFPWERNDRDQGKPEDAVSRLIEYLGDDPTRDELLETPARVLRFYDELRNASEQEIVATVFDSSTKDLIVISGIPFASLCEHHMLPFFGEAAIGYIPNGSILGLSKPARAVQQAAAALTVQEHLTAQVAEQISEWTKSPAVAVFTTAVHSCMVIRGVKAIGSRTSASAMLGSFRTAPELRAEFFAVVEGASRL
jgi:GTP cyclohydrolase I